MIVTIAAQANVRKPRALGNPPLGLKWNQAKRRVVQHLKKRFKLLDEQSDKKFSESVQRYSGKFAGADSVLQLVFRNEKLVLVVVRFVGQTGPLSKRWEEKFKLIRKKFGKPHKLVEIPASSAELLKQVEESYPKKTRNSAKIKALSRTLASAQSFSRYEELDLHIQSGKWTPGANWRFEKGMVTVYIDKKLKVIAVSYFSNKAVTLIEAESKQEEKKQLQDF
jgi:hypothetical protein